MNATINNTIKTNITIMDKTRFNIDEFEKFIKYEAAPFEQEEILDILDDILIKCKKYQKLKKENFDLQAEVDDLTQVNWDLEDTIEELKSDITRLEDELDAFINPTI